MVLAGFKSRINASLVACAGYSIFFYHCFLFLVLPPMGCLCGDRVFRLIENIDSLYISALECKLSLIIIIIIIIRKLIIWRPMFVNCSIEEDPMALSKWNLVL